MSGESKSESRLGLGNDREERYGRVIAKWSLADLLSELESGVSVLAHKMIVREMRRRIEDNRTLRVALNELLEQAEGMHELLTGAFEIQLDPELAPIAEVAEGAIKNAKTVLAKVS